MKVLHCITSTGVGGAQVMLLRYLRALGNKASNHAVVSLMAPGAIGDDISALGVPVLSANMRRGSTAPNALFKLRAIIVKFAPDILHGWMYHGNLATSFTTFGMKHPPPVIWDVHHSLQNPKNESRSTQWVINASRRISGRLAGITYCSRISAEQHEAYGFSDHHSKVIPNGIDTEEFRPDPTAQAALRLLAGIPENRKIIGNVGRDHPMKDQARMVAAVARLIKRGYDVHALLLGDGQDVGNAKKAAAQLGIEDRVTALGERRDVPRIVAGFDIFLLPSAWGEAFPLAVCEAMACEVPAVVTDVGDSGWIVGDPKFVARPADTEAQTTALARLLDLNDAERRALGSAARTRIQDNFSMDQYIAARDVFYEASLALQQAPSRSGWAALPGANAARETK